MASMFYTGVFLLGIISWVLTPRELFPSVSFPQLLVITRYGNAAPEEIENLITKVIEESVGTVPNLKRVRSLSKEGISLVTLEFDWGTDMGFAHLSAREKIDQIKDRLPSEAEEPIINRINPFAQPMMIFSISGEDSGNRAMAHLTEVAKKVVKARLEKVTGVASANISGGLEREIQVLVDRGRMEASNVALSQIVDALKDTNLNYPGGTVQGKFYEYLLRTMGEFKNLGEIGKTVVKVDKPPEYAQPEENRHRAKRVAEVQTERILHLDSLADVVDTFKDRTSFSRHNGRDDISLAVQKQADANVLSTAVRVRAAVEELAPQLPKGMRMDMIYDESEFIQSAISGLVSDGIMGAFLAFMVLISFLRNFRTSFIAAFTIPASTLATFIFMYFGHVSTNMLSLAGIGLAVGSLVDNAIVCMENITRHREELGKDDITAAVDGTEEVAIPMFSSAITNVAVFMPLCFAKGVAQKLFMDLFITNTAATMASWLLALTLIPQLVSYPLPLTPLVNYIRRRFFHHRIAEPAAEASPKEGGAHAEASLPAQEGGPAPSASRLHRILRTVWKFRKGIPDETHHKMRQTYLDILLWVIYNPKRTMMYMAAGVAVSFVLLAFQNKVFMPQFDQGQFLLKLQMPVGTRLERTDKVMQKLERVLGGVRAVKDVTVSVGSNNSESVDALGPHQAQAIVGIDRALSPTDDVIAALKKSLEREDLEGGEVQYILQGSVLASAFETSSPIIIEVKGPDLIVIKKMSEDIMGEIATIPSVYGVKTSLALPSAETRVEVDKVRAAGYGLSVAEIARTALIGVKGFIATTYKEGGEEVGVRVQLRETDRNDITSISHIAVRTGNNLMVPLSDVATLFNARGPSEIKHLDQQRAVVVSANIMKRSTSEVLKDVADKLASYQKLSDYTIILSGESLQIKESFGGLAIAMVMGVVLNYMIMAAQFEDMWHPAVVMATIPLGIMGVALSLFVTHTPISAPVILGCIMLGGMVVNNGIILIDFMNVRRRAGSSLWDAVLFSAGARFRPIVMSNLTSVLGVLPMAMGLSEGSELTAPMAVVSVGGLSVSAILTLVLIPMLYYYLENWRETRAGVQPAEAAS
jgi:HAE1 family hydrophobic/amphiphilic exporter-1